MFRIIVLAREFVKSCRLMELVPLSCVDVHSFPGLLLGSINVMVNTILAWYYLSIAGVTSLTIFAILDFRRRKSGNQLVFSKAHVVYPN